MNWYILPSTAAGKPQIGPFYTDPASASAIAEPWTGKYGIPLLVWTGTMWVPATGAGTFVPAQGF